MTVKLRKNSSVNITKDEPSLNKVGIGIGWQSIATGKLDLDVSAFLLTENGTVMKDEDFIFYGNLESECHSVVHSGDNKKGKDLGDAESLTVSLDLIPSHVKRIVFTTTIDKYKERKQHFGLAKNSYIRIYDQENFSDEQNSVPKELARYDLTEDCSSFSAMIFGELYLEDGCWKFRAVGQGFDFGLLEIATNFGVDAEE